MLKQIQVWIVKTDRCALYVSWQTFVFLCCFGSVFIAVFLRSHFWPLHPLLSAHNSDFTLSILPALASVNSCSCGDSFSNCCVRAVALLELCNPELYLCPSFKLIQDVCTFSARQKAVVKKPLRWLWGTGLCITKIFHNKGLRCMYIWLVNMNEVYGLFSINGTLQGDEFLPWLYTSWILHFLG